MNRPRRLDPFVFLGLTLLAVAALPACGTKDIGASTVLRDNNLQPGPNQGSVVIVNARLQATYAELLSDAQQPPPDPNLNVLFLLVVDGKKLVDSDGQLFTVPPGNNYGAGIFEAGMHHFEITEVGGGTIFAADGQVTSGAVTRLYTFGPLDALQGRFVSYPLETPAGKEHISAINLARSGVQIEVVSCTGAATCTPVSPQLALGEAFDADFPASGPADAGAYGTSLSGDGVGFGYRQVATPSLPAPPVLPLAQEYSGLWDEPPGLKFVAAPEFILADGTCPLACN